MYVHCIRLHSVEKRAVEKQQREKNTRSFAWIYLSAKHTMHKYEGGIKAQAQDEFGLKAHIHISNENER